MKKLTAIIAAFVFYLLLIQTSCEEGDIYKYQESPFYFDGKQDTTILTSGLSYMKSEEGSGLQAQPGAKVNVNLYYWAYKTGNSSFTPMYLSTKEPMEFVLGRTLQIKGLQEGILQMKEGSKYRFLIPPYLAYGSDANGSVPPYATLLYDIELVTVVNPLIVTPFNVSGKDTITTSTGLKLIPFVEGTGIKAEKDKTVVTSYTGYLQDGTIFDSTDQFGETYEFKVGEDKVIKGWEEAILYMKEGSKYRIIVPPDLAYGTSGSGSIPANATIIFDLSLIQVK